jgi:hypothetical protein
MSFNCWERPVQNLCGRIFSTQSRGVLCAEEVVNLLDHLMEVRDCLSLLRLAAIKPLPGGFLQTGKAEILFICPSTIRPSCSPGYGYEEDHSPESRMTCSWAPPGLPVKQSQGHWGCCRCCWPAWGGRPPGPLPLALWKLALCVYVK